MLNNSQDQIADSGSTAIQAGRDVNYHGLSVTEVRELCTLFLKSNFPELREEAKRTAEEHVRAFASALETKLVNEAASIVLDKFKDPDVQAAINDAVQATARKGPAANPAILCSLIAERVAQNSNAYKDVVISEAVQAAPRLTSAQISLLSFIHFATSFNITNTPNVAALEYFGQKAIAFSSPGFSLSESQRRHLQYAGVASIDDTYEGDIYKLVYKFRYNYLNYPSQQAFKQALIAEAPSYAKVLDQFNAEKLLKVNLTSVGYAIAIANTSNYLGELDYNLWIK